MCRRSGSSTGLWILQTVPDYDYGKLLEEHADSILGEYIRSMRKKEPGVCTAKALEYGVNALLGYDC